MLPSSQEDETSGRGKEHPSCRPVNNGETSSETRGDSAKAGLLAEIGTVRGDLGFQWLAGRGVTPRLEPLEGIALTCDDSFQEPPPKQLTAGAEFPLQVKLRSES